MEEDDSFVKKGEKIAVPYVEDLVNFDELSKARKIEAEGKLNNKMSDQELESKAQNLLFSGDGKLAQGLDLKSVGAGLAGSVMEEDCGLSLFRQEVLNQDVRKWLLTGDSARAAKAASQRLQIQAPAPRTGRLLRTARPPMTAHSLGLQRRKKERRESPAILANGLMSPRRKPKQAEPFAICGLKVVRR